MKDNRFEEETFHDLLQCLSVVCKAEYYLYACRVGTVSVSDIMEISNTLRREVTIYKSRMIAKETTIAGLQRELSNATSNVTMFESALADYKSGRRI